MAGRFFKRISEGFAGLCESKNKYGQPCGCKQVRICKNGKARCKYHGGSGKQTGPKTKAGKLRAFANLTGPNSAAARKRANRNLLLSSRRNPNRRITKAERARQERRGLQEWLDARGIRASLAKL